MPTISAEEIRLLVVEIAAAAFKKLQLSLIFSLAALLIPILEY